MKKFNTISIDLAKSVFQVAIINRAGKVFSNRQISRKKLQSFISRQGSSRIVMEACGSSNYWGRQFKSAGHEVLLIAGQHVKPFVKRNKNDANDAVAIYEASQRPNMRYVSIKTLEQQDIQSLHRTRQRLIDNRTNLTNHARGILAEYGITFNLGTARLRKGLVSVLSGENSNQDITSMLIEMTQEWYEELLTLDKAIKEKDKKIAQIAKQSEQARRLMQVEGIGPITATAMVATLGQAASDFKNGRQMAAFLGLTPKQYSSGGQVKSGKISKRGDTYLRTLLVNGATSVLNVVGKKHDPKSHWIKQLLGRIHKNKVRIALANKMARIAWVILAKGENYKPELASAVS